MLMSGALTAPAQQVQGQTAPEPEITAATTTQTHSTTKSDQRAEVERLERNFFRDFFRDEKAIWTSPFRMKQSHWKWGLPLAGATAAMIATDSGTTDEVNELVASSPNSLRASRWASRAGGAVATFGSVTAMYLAGRWTGNDRLRKTGLLATEAVIHAGIVVNTLKLATNRQRPDEGDGRGRFWKGGKSFPSGHAGTSFALATVVAYEYRDKPLIRWGAYGVAAAISASRVTGLKHHPSDVVIGGLIGYGIGRYIWRSHQPSGATGSGTTGGNTQATWMPVISTQFNHAAGSYGLSMFWSF